MRFNIIFVLLIVVVCSSCSDSSSSNEKEGVLFVGNSLTYYGNVPAVVSSLAEENDQPVVSDMIVEGGATLAQRVADGSVEWALSDREYTAVVLQERGGDLTCSFGPDSCAKSREAIESLSSLGREMGVDVFLLGTYQTHPSVSRQLVAAESSAAEDAGIPYIEVSNRLHQLRSEVPDLEWFASDGAHPGKHLALLNAILVYEVLQGGFPAPEALTVNAPIYGSDSGLTDALRQADAPPPEEGTATTVHYSTNVMKKLIEAIKKYQ